VTRTEATLAILLALSQPGFQITREAKPLRKG
jgi:hypothetical protein